jgi:hypothetical protein
MENIKRIMNKLYSRKSNIKSIRVDWPTQALIEEMAQQFETTDSEIIRASVWIVSILLDKNVTLRQVLRPEAIEKLISGDDVSVVDALSLDNLIVNRFKNYVASR